MPRSRTVADRERDAKALSLRARGYTHRQISAQLGWKSPASAVGACTRAMQDMYREDIDKWRQIELDKLDDLTREAWDAMQEAHYLVSQGKVVKDDDGTMLVNAVDKVSQLGTLLLKISESRRKLLGIDAPPQKAPTPDNLDAEIETLVKQLSGLGDVPKQVADGTVAAIESAAPPGA